MPKRTIEVPLLPLPDVPNIQGVIFPKDSLDNAIEVFMDGTAQYVMLQKENQLGDGNADIELGKICGSVNNITFDEVSKSYIATVKLIPNKNSAFVLDEISKGINFTLGTNKVGMLAAIQEDDDTEYPEGTLYKCDKGFEIVSTSMFDTNLIKPQDSTDGKSDTEAYIPWEWSKCLEYY